jgi:regulatory protein
MFARKAPTKKPDDVEHAYQYAMFVLNLQLRTVGELTEKMANRGYTPAVTQTIIERLLGERFLDDVRYAEMYIDSLKRHRPYGYFQIRIRLQKKLLPKELYETALAEYFSESDEWEVLQRVAKSEYKTLAAVKQLEPKEKQRFMRRLASRGFRISVMQRLWSTPREE